MILKNYCRQGPQIKPKKKKKIFFFFFFSSFFFSFPSLFADTWLSLDAYDRELLPKRKLTKKKVSLTSETISKDLVELRNVLIKKGEATDIFGRERHASAVAGIVGN